MSILKGLNPEKVLGYFEELTKIPHGSGNEKVISDYLANFGKERGFVVIQDDELNVIIKKPATQGYENAPVVTIQGHMDMVCEKNKDKVHDFEKDPLELRIDGDYLYANGTTLGADNGIAVAYGLAILDSKELKHPAIELFVTTGEETGMYGAIAVDPKNLDGKILLNIDSEEEGIFLVSCAGGVTNYVNINTQWEDASNEALKLEVKGLKGGHSGMEIIKQRGNANKLMGRLLNAISKEVDFNISHISGGAKNNAIPREAEATITVAAEDVEKVRQIATKSLEIFKTELRIQDPDVTVIVEKSETSKQLTDLVVAPNGIQTMSEDIKGLVESSLNLGVIEFSEEKVTFISAVRSSVKTLKNAITDRIDVVAKLVGAGVINDSDYPEWQYEPNSPIRDLCVETYKNVAGEEPKIDAIHAGLECGLIGDKFNGNIDQISFGPNIFDVHTPDEHVSISSLDRMYDYLLSVLAEIR